MSRKNLNKRSKLGKYVDGKGIYQKWLFEQLKPKFPGINQMTLSRWCTGEATPNQVQYAAIAQILDAEITEIQ